MSTEKTTAEEYFEAIQEYGAGTLYYLAKGKDSNAYIFEPVIIDTKNRDLTIRILKRTMQRPDFLAFPGTPEMDAFITEADNVEGRC